ncbi:MAG: protein TolR [Deltaproteobacteria bacterium]|jgi:biopolymer transport protein TolR|nr:protein TolR [Deltaproteobacteria bacterium]MBW2489299.1 protein TolR [Deltaproteobacteria bacterium]MBW2517136.1 protein TolR [Deltaproteobacteria bacterium]
MKAGDSSGHLMSDINVTPFVDVMLVLLIIFMVTAPMMMQGMDVALPEATAEPLESEKEHLIITLNTQNEVFINDFKVSVDGLGEKLKNILEGRADREVFLKADKTITWGTVAQVMAEIKGAGVEKLGMVTEPEKFEKESKK